jgi:hypothetical protein
MNKCRLTKQSVHMMLGTATARRAASSTGLFLASVFSCSQAESTPGHCPLRKGLGAYTTEHHLEVFSE